MGERGRIQNILHPHPSLLCAVGGSKEVLVTPLCKLKLTRLGSGRVSSGLQPEVPVVAVGGGQDNK